MITKQDLEKWIGLANDAVNSGSPLKGTGQDSGYFIAFDTTIRIETLIRLDDIATSLRIMAGRESKVLFKEDGK